MPHLLLADNGDTGELFFPVSTALVLALRAVLLLGRHKGRHKSLAK